MGVPEGTVIGLGAGGGAAVMAMAGPGGGAEAGAGAAGGGAAAAGGGAAEAAGAGSAGAGAAGAGAAGGVDCAVSGAGAGVLLHPPRSSKPANDKVLNKPKAAGLRAGPTLVWPELEKACLVIVLSVNEICAVRCPAQSSSCLQPLVLGTQDLFLLDR